MTVRAYIRVSTAGQAELSPEVQRQRIEAWCAANGHDLVEVYLDVASASKRGNDRPELTRLRRDLRPGETVVVTRLDRLGRSMVETSKLFAEFDDLGASVASLEENIDASTTTGKFMRNLLASIAEMEAGTIADRVRASVPARKAKRGGIYGGGRRPYGFEVDRVTVRESEALVIRERIVGPLLTGTSENRIARMLNADGVPSASGGTWSPGTLGKLIRREHLRRVLNEETYGRLRALLAARDARPGKGRGRETARPTLAHGRFTSPCGAALVYRVSNDSYVCKRKADEGPAACSCKPANREAVDGMLLDWIERALIGEKSLAAQVDRAQQGALAAARSALRERQREAMALEAHLDRARRDYRAGSLSAETYETERREVEAELDGARAAADRAVDQLAAVEAGRAAEDARRKVELWLRDLRGLVEEGTDATAAIAAALDQMAVQFFLLADGLLGVSVGRAGIADARVGAAVAFVGTLPGHEAVPVPRPCDADPGTVWDVKFGGGDPARWRGTLRELPLEGGEYISDYSEVKSKAGDRHGDPLEMIPPAKIARIRRAADAWLARHPELDGLDVRFDVVAVRGTRIEHVPDAF